MALFAVVGRTGMGFINAPLSTTALRAGADTRLDTGALADAYASRVTWMATGRP